MLQYVYVYAYRVYTGVNRARDDPTPIKVPSASVASTDVGSDAPGQDPQQLVKSPQLED